MLRIGLSLFVAGVLLAGSGCSIKPVKAWERGDLARPEMAFDPDPTQAAFREHVYFSKEASSGGASLGGGGCGCN